jgi:adenosylcobinamide-GDP ribazoletransferase
MWFWRAFQVALGLLTTLPVPTRAWREGEVRESVQAYPLVGLVIGLLLTLAWALLSGLPPLLAGVLVVALWLLLTGALHFDGLCDVADAAFAAKLPEERRRIARDPSVGAFALAAGSLLLLAKAAALASLPHAAWLVAIPVLARTLVVWPMAHYPVHSSSSLGRAARISPAEAGFPLALGVVMSGVLALVFLDLWRWLIVLGAAFVSTVLLARWLSARMGGLSGDAYGALIEGSEALMLVVVVALW